LVDRPTIADVLDARRRIQPYVVRTPLHHYPALDDLIGAAVYVKHENHQALGAFKMRGALNVISLLSPTEKEAGVVVASTGNFGQGVAHAARTFGVPAHVVVPVDANPNKVRSMRQLGANLVFHGEKFDDSLAHAERLSKEEGYRFVHSANEWGLVPGTATYSLEIMEDLPQTDVIIAPVGGGSGVCGACIVAKTVRPEIEVIGVQAADAPGAFLSWKEGRIVESRVDTGAEGIATRVGYELTQEIMRDMLDDFVLVEEGEIDRAVYLHVEHTHSLPEHAGAAPLAAALKIKDSLAGKNVVLVMSGGNITVDQLKACLAHAES
jgi:threonine dehydratase